MLRNKMTFDEALEEGKFMFVSVVGVGGGGGGGIAAIDSG
jgi:hypothetical protein